MERAQGRIERQKKIVEEAQQLLTKCESQLAAGLQDLERLRAEARACPAPPASHTEPSIETTELRDLRREVEQLRRERNEWLAKPNSQFTEDVWDSRSSRMAGSTQPTLSAVVSSPCHKASSVVVPKQAFQIWIAGSQSWVKGHAKMQHVRAGTISLWQLQANELEMKVTAKLHGPLRGFHQLWRRVLLSCGTCRTSAR